MIDIISNFQVSVKRKLKKIVYYGNQFYCPVCNSKIRLLKPAGIIPRPNAICPVCGSFERHRLIWLFLVEKTDLFSKYPKKMLHIAPEACFVERLSRLSYIDYVTGDLFEKAMVKLDITDICFPDNYFDVIYCSHVLEHVSDDHRAMSELYRVLKPDGWAILQVPIQGDVTYEDWTILAPKAREIAFGQSDHVRVYGADFKNRLEKAGFNVQVVSYLTNFDNESKRKYALSNEKDDIYYCNLS
jgi:predicted SAM-dependent methyltransferase